MDLNAKKLGPGRFEQQVDRGLGLLSSLLKIGPAVRAPAMHRVLRAISVLERDPAGWDVSTALARLPWGAGPFEAPPAQRPAGFDGAWPQAAELDPRLYPAVIHIDRSDTRDHLFNNAARYLGQVLRLTPPFALRSLNGPRLLPVDDAELAAMLSRTSLAQFIRLGVSEPDRRSFGERIREDGSEYATADFSFAPREHALPGVHVAGTVTLLRREGGAYHLVAIRVDDRVFGPGDGVAWQLARFFVLQGAHTRLVLVTHPSLHFPADVINAVTRSVLPPGHLLHRLLLPHTMFTLGLNKAVIHHRRSVLLNCQQEIYAPLAYDAKGIIELVAAGRNGVAGSPSYEPYRFGGELFGNHVPYGQFREDWFDVYLEFAGEALRALPADDPHVVAWADHIHRWVPGFPGGAAVLHGDTLARAVATYICSVSVFHSGDHHSYGAIPPAAIPWRLRVHPPSRQVPERVELDDLVTPEDHFRHLLCHAMFFVPVVRRSLDEVLYEFSERSAVRAAAGLRAAARQLDDKWRGSGFPTSVEIACSVQY